MIYDRLAELRALQLACFSDLTGQIVGDSFGFNRVLKGEADHAGCLAPSHMVEHHGA